MRNVSSVAAFAPRLEGDRPLVDGHLLQVVTACFVVRDDFVELACFVELDDFVEAADSVGLGESEVCRVDLAGSLGGIRFRDGCQGDCRAFLRDDCLGYIPDECRVFLRGDCLVCIRDGCLAYRLGGCRVYIRGEYRDDIRVGSLRACCSRAGCRSLADDSWADDNPNCRHSRDGDSIRQVVDDTNSWADDSHRASRPTDRGCSRCCGLPSSIPNHPIPRDDC
jgi:hypothetical protein